jgi:hypothetical protein
MSGLPRFGAGGSPDFPGLYFIGFKESPRGALYEANRDARRLAEAPIATSPPPGRPFPL